MRSQAVRFKRRVTDGAQGRRARADNTSMDTSHPRRFGALLARLQAPVPVTARTALAMAAFQAQEEAGRDVGLREVVNLLLDDPLALLRLHAEVARRRGDRGDRAETATASSLLLGIGGTFRAFQGAPVAEEALAQDPVARHGLARVLRRAQRAARFAAGFAIHRQDDDYEVVYEAALLAEFAEALVWCHLPACARAMRNAQQHDVTLRSAEIQQRVLGTPIAPLRRALMEAWRLPGLLVRCADPDQAGDPRVRSVQLALRVARHTQDGWEDAALPDDFTDVGLLLNVSPESAHRKLLDLDS